MNKYVIIDITKASVAEKYQTFEAKDDEEAIAFTKGLYTEHVKLYTLTKNGVGKMLLNLCDSRVAA
ncbi:MAG: hypothetical protein J6Y37_03890 [Paludibacteraceae bacterium]|nr:hypothetical protein [Paludibacteraceae bacterium]